MGFQNAASLIGAFSGGTSDELATKNRDGFAAEADPVAAKGDAHDPAPGRGLEGEHPLFAESLAPVVPMNGRRILAGFEWLVAPEDQT